MILRNLFFLPFSHKKTSKFDKNEKIHVHQAATEHAYEGGPTIVSDEAAIAIRHPTAFRIGYFYKLVVLKKRCGPIKHAPKSVRQVPSGQTSIEGKVV